MPASRPAMWPRLLPAGRSRRNRGNRRRLAFQQPDGGPLELALFSDCPILQPRLQQRLPVDGFRRRNGKPNSVRGCRLLVAQDLIALARLMEIVHILPVIGSNAVVGLTVKLNVVGRRRHVCPRPGKRNRNKPRPYRHQQAYVDQVSAEAPARLEPEQRFFGAGSNQNGQPRQCKDLQARAAIWIAVQASGDPRQRQWASQEGDPSALFRAPKRESADQGEGKKQISNRQKAIAKHLSRRSHRPDWQRPGPAPIREVQRPAFFHRGVSLRLNRAEVQYRKANYNDAAP